MSLDTCPATDSAENLPDLENIERLLDAIPFLRSLKRAALLLYLVRVGMDSLAENPLRALEAAPTPETIQPNIEAAKERIRAERERGRGSTLPPGQTEKMTALGVDTTGSNRSLNRVREKLEREAEEAKKAKPPKRKRGHRLDDPDVRRETTGGSEG